MEVIRISDRTKYQISDSDVVKRVLSGEKELYEILIKRNNQKLYQAVRSYIKDETEIEDIMQNTYLKGYEKLYQFKHTATFITWLIRIGINESLARLKQKNNTYTFTSQTSFYENNTILETPDTTQMNPEKKIIIKEAKQLLESSIDALEPKYKTVYVLKEIEEMSIKEVAKCLNISSSNVKVRLHRAKNMLKEQLYELTNNKDIFEFGFSRCDRITEQVMKNIL
ncbi:MAG: RNA polymerase sigma factor [Flavobacteriales bacterium]|nr:RNA polymerase sigma factor [Flavobacteriales bacterium]